MVPSTRRGLDLELALRERDPFAHAGEAEAGGVGPDLETGAVVVHDNDDPRVLLSNVHVHARSRRGLIAFESASCTTR